MKVEFLETYIHQGVRYEEGDRTTFDAVTGTFLCDAGMVKDLAGVVPTAPRDPHVSVTLDVANINIAHAAKEVTGG